MIKRAIGVSAFVLAFGGMGTGAWAGPLDPPAGPVVSTQKTLVEVEPRIAVNATNTPGNVSILYRITAPGSYYLTGNITGEESKHGIVISADDVTLDLMGFTLQGVPGSIDGITTLAHQRNITVRNGTVCGWIDGLDLVQGGGGSNVGCLIEGIRALNNTSRGITGNAHAIVRNCVAIGNGTEGISAYATSVIESCIASANGTTGILAGSGSVVSGCSATANDTDGIRHSGSGTVVHCSAENNGGNGITASGGASVMFSTCRGNTTGAGIFVSGENARIEGNNCVLNDRGIYVTGSGKLILRNSCSENTTANYAIVTNNRYGPIVDITAAGAAAVTGNAAASTLSTSDANANYAY